MTHLLTRIARDLKNIIFPDYSSPEHPRLPLYRHAWEENSAYSYIHNKNVLKAIICDELILNKELVVFFIEHGVFATSGWWTSRELQDAMRYRLKLSPGDAVTSSGIQQFMILSHPFLFSLTFQCIFSKSRARDRFVLPANIFLMMGYRFYKPGDEIVDIYLKPAHKRNEYERWKKKFPDDAKMFRDLGGLRFARVPAHEMVDHKKKLTLKIFEKIYLSEVVFRLSQDARDSGEPILLMPFSGV